MSQPSYGQPPPPAGPAPPLPSSGPPQGAYANYGYGSVAPARHAAASLNGGGASHQQQWNQQWQQPQQQQQQQQPYYPQPQPPNAVAASGVGPFAAPRPPSQPGPYRNMAAPNANAPSVNQNAAYSPHQPQQSVPYSYQPQASPMQSQSPSQHHQPPAPPAYGYTPPMPPSQNVSPSPHNNNAQSWPGAYVPGTQVGPPNKKPRYQAPAPNVPAPAAPYGPPGAMPMAPAGGYMAGGGTNQYSPQQQYGWQGPNQAQAQPMHPLPVPVPSVPYGQVSAGSGGHANVSGQGAQFAHPGRNNMGGKGSGGIGDGGLGRGLNRKGAPNRGNMQQTASGQRVGLPANPTASVNAARAPNGQTRAWGAPGGGIQAGRRVSSASSVHSDKGAMPGQMAKKAVSGSKNMVPPNAPRGPNNARNKATANAPAGSQVPKSGGAAAVQNDRGNQHASADSNVTGNAAGKDASSSSKRAHTDFRILGLEIKQLDWSWHAPRALAKAEHDVAEPTVEASDSTQNAEEMPANAEDDTLVAVAESARPTGHDTAGGSVEATSGSKTGATDGQGDNDHDEEHPLQDENVDKDVAVPDKEDEDVGMEADVNVDADADADADDDTDAQGHVDADEDADDNEEGGSDAEAADADDVADDVSVSHADTETAASERQHSVAATPEPSNGSSKGVEVDRTQVTAQDGSKSKPNGAKVMAGLRESTKLRLCFAAMSNAGPEGAPTGPKASKAQAMKTESETQVQDETIADPTAPKPSTKEDAEEQTAETQAEPNQALQVPEEVEIKNEPEEASSLQANEVNPAEDSDNARADPAVEVAPTSEDAQATDAEMPGPDAEVEAAGKVDEKGDGEAEGENEGSEAVEGEDKEIEGEAEEKNAQETSLQPGDDAVSDAPKPKGLRSTVQSSPQPKGPPQLSLNRIFLSFAANRKRLAIDAEAVKSVKIHRSEHWIEICIDITRQSDPATRRKGDEYLVCNGTLLEKRTKGQENYTAMTKSDIAAAWDAAQADAKPTEAEMPDEEHLELPPFFRLPDSSAELVLHVQLDPSAPLPEPAWLRKNDLNELLATLQRGSTAIAGKSDTAVSVATAQHVWTGKIEVLDPDPPPSMSTFLYEWVKESFIGSQKERRRFVDELLGREKKQPIKTEEEAPTAPSESDNAGEARVARSWVEIVLRLIKGERVTPPPPSLSEALSSTSYTSSTSYPGLFMLGLLDVSLLVDAARTRARVDRMLMAFPRAMLLKAVDLTFKDVVESGRKGDAGPVAPVKAAGVAKGGVPARRHQQPGRQHRGGAAARHGKRKRG